jgi:hypothetical protein
VSGLPYTLPSYLPGPPPPARIPGSLVPAAESRAESLDLILSQYVESPRLLSWLGAYLDRGTALDAAIVDAYEDALDVERAPGVWLDNLGRIMGEPRRGRGDYEHRRGLRVRVLVNRSSGTPAELARIARLHEELDAEAVVRVRREGPGSVVVYIDGEAAGLPSWPHGYLSEAVAAGVRLQTVSIPLGVDRADAFRLCAVAAAGAKSLVGLAEVDLSRGGALASVLSST